MARGQASKVGDTNIAQNGYHYTRTEDGWRLTHHLVAEKTLKRRLRDDEQAYFIDKDKTNFDPKNIGVRPKAKSTAHKRLAQLQARRNEIDAQIQELEKSLEAQRL